jgi:outer membrane assembly lipoprotein YfiO
MRLMTDLNRNAGVDSRPSGPIQGHASERDPIPSTATGAHAPLMQGNVSMPANRTSTCAIVTCGALLLFGAASAKEARSRKFTNCDKQLEKAVTRYQKGRYSDVRISLDEFKYQCSGHPAMDTALFYLGMAMLKSNQEEQAKIQFERLLQDFPKSAFAEEAHFRIGYASYQASPVAQRDQSYTEKAIHEFSTFLERRPDSDYADSARHYIELCHKKLAKKRFLNARFYEKLNHDEAAVVYYSALIERYPASELIPEATLSLARALIRLNRQSEARALLQTLLDSDAPADIARSARTILTRLDSGAQPEKASGSEPAQKRQSVKPADESPEPANEGGTPEADAADTRDAGPDEAAADAKPAATERAKAARATTNESQPSPADSSRIEQIEQMEPQPTDTSGQPAGSAEPAAETGGGAESREVASESAIAPQDPSADSASSAPAHSRPEAPAGD